MSSEAPKSPRLGFIGQGYIGKNYADSFEDRGFEVVRYSNELSYSANKDAIQSCDFVFIAVPTPTTPEGFDDSIVREVISLVGKGKTAVVKSTISPGTTASLQQDNPDVFVLHNPEFLNEITARYDVDNPIKTIVGTGATTDEHRARAEAVLALMPKAPFELVTDGITAEFLKYTHNTFGYSIILFMNILYDLAQSYGVDWEPVKESIAKNPWIPGRYLDPVHKGGRGAGGACFIKDFAAFRGLYEKMVEDPKGLALLRAFEQKNNDLLRASGKDLALLNGVYGEESASKRKKT
jgi:UDP-N-acetyl-D-glucosamine dehydrogenase